MQYFANSDRGLKRSYNQDRYLMLEVGERGFLAAVFDGMGGHAGGEMAAELAAAAFAETFAESTPADAEEGAALLKAAARLADDRILAYAGEREGYGGMGTTVTALLLLGEEGVTLNVGDSRTYLLREGELYLLTHDDSYVQALIDSGRLAPEEAPFHPRRNVITCALGSLGDREPVTSVGYPRPGDSYLLCSDGLWDLVGEGVMRSILSQQLSLTAAVGYLIAAANEHGGEDNITVALLRV